MGSLILASYLLQLGSKLWSHWGDRATVTGVTRATEVTTGVTGAIVFRCESISCTDQCDSLTYQSWPGLGKDEDEDEDDPTYKI